MSRTISVTIDERTWVRLSNDALAAGVDFRTYLARALNAEAATRDTEDARRRSTAARIAEPPRIAPAIAAWRPERVNWNAVDAALDRAGLLPDRSGR